MSSKKDKRQKELEKEIEKLQRRLSSLRSEDYDEDRVVIIRSSDDDDIEFSHPLPPLPPKPAKPAKPARPAPPHRHSTRSTTQKTLTPQEKERMRQAKEKIRQNREKLNKELHGLKDDLQIKKREFDKYRRDLREKEHKIRDKERLLRDKRYSTSYSFDVELDDDIDGITSEMEIRLGEYTRSILSSVADSLKSSMGIAIKSAGDIGTEMKVVGKDFGKMGKEIGERISKEVHVSFGPNIPEDKLEEFFEIGANIVSAVGDSNRLRILKELESGPMYQKELSEATNLRGGTFKHHMDKLMEESVKFVTQEVVRGRYLLTTRGREALKLAEIQFMRYLEEKGK
ncbi:MAG: ArsR family transcriptional regulator, partial [Candidatus Heimdallarchaeota archaeon]